MFSLFGVKLDSKPFFSNKTYLPSYSIGDDPETPETLSLEEETVLLYCVKHVQDTGLDLIRGRLMGKEWMVELAFDAHNILYDNFTRYFTHSELKKGFHVKHRNTIPPIPTAEFKVRMAALIKQAKDKKAALNV